MSESQCGAECPGEGSPGRARSGLQRPPPPPSLGHPSPPASVAPLLFPPAAGLLGLRAPVCSYLSPPPLGTQLPCPGAHLGPLNLGPPDTPHSFPAPAAPSALRPPEGRRAGWGVPSFGGGASWDPCAQTIVDARGPGTSAPYSTGNAPPAGCAPVCIPGPPRSPVRELG